MKTPLTETILDVIVSESNFVNCVSSRSSPIMYLVTEEPRHFPNRMGNHVSLLQIKISHHVDSDDGVADVRDYGVDVDHGDDDEDDLDPSQCVVSADGWSDPCQQKKSVHL